jgi:KDO2-lipid IV(A) lauroyltransferase
LRRVLGVHPAYVAYRLGSGIARALPEPLLGPVVAATGSIASRVMNDRREMVARNLRRVIGPELEGRELRKMVDDTFESYVRYWGESFRLPGTPPDELDAGITHDGLHYVLDALEDGTGIIMAMPHLGGWEWAAFWLASVHNVPITAVVEPVEPPELAEWFVGLRRSLGINVVPLGPSAGTEVAKAIKANHLVCLLCDRDLPGTGVEVEFFGETTTIPGGPATLALRTGAPLCPSAVYFEGGRRHGVALPPLDTKRRGKLRDDVARVSQDLALAFEDLIREAPDQWHLLQPNWPSDKLLAAQPERGARSVP